MKKLLAIFILLFLLIPYLSFADISIGWIGPIGRIWQDKTTSPAVTNDGNSGYREGDIWIDETNDKAYLCVDSTAGAAVWRQLDVAGGSAVTGTTLTATTGLTTPLVITGTLSFTQGSGTTITLSGVSATVGTFRESGVSDLTVFNSAGIYGEIIHEGAYNQTGDFTTSGSVVAGNEIIHNTYTTSASSPYTVADVNTVFIGSANGSGHTELIITLPAITASLDGWPITFKDLGSGASYVILSAATDSNYTPTSDALIESSLGTTSSVSMVICTGNSGVSVFEADYVSGSTPIYRLINWN